MAGIKEVAEEAGVSTATVSRALRGLHHVNQQTREKIIAAAEKLNYPLNTERQGATSGRTNSVELLRHIFLVGTFHKLLVVQNKHFVKRGWIYFSITLAK